VSCPACGADVPDFAACQSLFRDFNAQAQSDPVIGAVWWAIVDAYAMQHVEQYGKSAKSYSAHLMGLCCFAEHKAAPEAYRAIHIWLDGKAKTAKPAIIALGQRGKTTLQDVVREETAAQQLARSRGWVLGVWKAYESQHQLARDWLHAALSAPPPRKK
jgi:hypothetical protein